MSKLGSHPFCSMPQPDLPATSKCSQTVQLEAKLTRRPVNRTRRTADVVDLQAPELSLIRKALITLQAEAWTVN